MQLRLRFNFSWLTISGVLFGSIRAIQLVNENAITPLRFPHLTLYLVSRTLVDFVLVGWVLAVANSLIFGWRSQSNTRAPSQILKQTLGVVLLTSVLIFLKKYYPDLLWGPLAYLGFYVSHWVKENTFMFCSMVLSAILLSFLLERSKIVAKLFSLRNAFLLLAVVLAARAAYWINDRRLQHDLELRGAPNVILLTVDTLRADHLSVYGYARSTSPHLDRLARGNIVFKNAIAPWPKTNQSFACLLTGKYRHTTGIGVKLASFLPRPNLLISEALKSAGYYTAALVSNSNLSKYFNFGDGFDEYRELWAKRSGPARERGWYTAEFVTEEAVRWLNTHRDKKFFLWIHYIDPHTKYEPPAPYDSLFVGDTHYDRHDKLALEKIKPTALLGQETDPDFYIAQYDGEIRFTDDQIQIVLERLEQLKLVENTLLVFTADHGESFVENDFYFDHGKFAYENGCRVPLFIRYPKAIQSPRQIEDAVSLTDIFPTILEFAGLPPDSSLEGYSLRESLMRGKWTRPPQVFVEAGIHEERLQRAVRTKEWKLIYIPDPRDRAEMHGSPFELFNLREDPQEQTNLAGKSHPMERHLFEALLPWVQRADLGRVPLGASMSPSELDPATLEQLKSLGYVQ